MNKTLLLAGVASVFAFNAQALELTPYVGADYNANFINRASHFDTVFPDKYHSGSINVGTKISPYAAVEVFGEMAKKENKTITRTQYNAAGVDALGILPLSCHKEVALLGTVGVGRYKISVKEKINSSSVKIYDWGYRFGAGIQYSITENWDVRAMYRYVAFDGMKFHGEKTGIRGFNVLSLGVRYNF